MAAAPKDESAQQPNAPETDTSVPEGDPGPGLILGGGPYPIGTVAFVVTNNETGEQTAQYSLSCLGDTATLTGDWTPVENEGIGAIAADRMCLALGESAVQSRLFDGPATDLACAQVFGSADFAEVTGELSGSPVSTTFSRTDACGIADWDTIMVGLLPPATR